MLVKLQVRVTRKDSNDLTKEITSFEDYLVNADTISAVLAVPGAETCVIKLLGGDQILTKGKLDDVLRACNK